MVIKGYFAFPGSSSISGTSPLDCLLLYPGHFWVVLPICREAVGVFYSPRRLGIYIYIYIYHHVVLVAHIYLTLSHHFLLSFIALGRSSGTYPLSSHSCWMYVRASRPAFARPCVGVHKSTSLMSLSLVLQSGSSNLNSFRDKRQVAVQLVSCGVLPPGLVQDFSQHSCVIAV